MSEQKGNYFFTSESVTEGHPDKLCDQVSDSILDAILAKDPQARVACETMASTGLVLVAGQITTNSYVDIPKIVRKTIERIGYNSSEYGFDSHTCAVLTAIDEQSPDIALGVDDASDSEEQALGAGDQGMMFGYATKETASYMPLPISLAHDLAKQLTKVRKEATLSYLRPDGKTQVTVEYDQEHRPLRVDTVLVSAQHDESISLEQLRADIEREVIRAVIPAELLDKNSKFYINPTGRFVLGGPVADTGLTGRKIIVDTYGASARHGGGAFSGKDPTKVDRSAAYMARYVAKNLVAADLMERCSLELSYAIGMAQPLSIHVDTFGTSELSSQQVAQLVRAVFDLTPEGIIRELDLQRPIYEQTACYGHFGRDDLDLPWERLDKVEELKEKAQEYFG